MAENILGPFVVVDITLDVSVVSRWYQPADSGSISTAFQSSCCQAPKAVFLLKTGAGSSKTAGPLALPNLLRVPFTTWCDQPRSRGVAIIYLENPPHKNDPTATREMNPKPSCDRFCLSQTKKNRWLVKRGESYFPVNFLGYCKNKASLEPPPTLQKINMAIPGNLDNF